MIDKEIIKVMVIDSINDLKYFKSLLEDMLEIVITKDKIEKKELERLIKIFNEMECINPRICLNSSYLKEILKELRDEEN